MKVKELLAKKCRGACVEECDKFYAGVNFIHSTSVEYLDQWMIVWKMPCFMWMTLSEPLSWNNIKPCIQFVINNGVCTDYVTCFDELKKFMENNLNDEEFTSFLACQKWKIYFENCKNGECHSELLKISQFFAVLLHNTNI
jgi:hypothetical protein